jgi:hypothetical protein
MTVLTIYDISGIQDYLFGSNRLVHNISASSIVEEVSERWIDNLISSMKVGDIEQEQIEVELVYSGGGNAVLLFSSLKIAKEFTNQYSRLLLTCAPGLHVVIQHVEFDWQTPLSQVYKTALALLAQKKAQQRSPMPMLGLSVTAVCQYTGLPAIKTDPNDEDRFISAEIAAKSERKEEARNRLEAPFKNELGDLHFTYDFNLFGEKGEASYLALVHADGNGIGKRKQDVCDRYPDAADNRNFICALRVFSEQVKTAGKQALSETLSQLVKWYKKTSDEKDDQRLPFVPLIFGGDDTTFVCEGKLGLSLAAFFLQMLNQYQVDKKPIYACAGVAIVKNRYPFSRAYEMSSELCRNAKTAVRDLGDNKDALAIDWHFAVNGAVHSIQEIRAREYTVVMPFDLTTRPLFIGCGTDSLREWETFVNNIHLFTQADDWKDSRNKLKMLREVLRRGGEATSLYRKSLGLPEFPLIDDAPDCCETGWHGAKCAYFDAIEAMDFYTDIKGATFDD